MALINVRSSVRFRPPRPSGVKVQHCILAHHFRVDGEGVDIDVGHDGVECIQERCLGSSTAITRSA